MRRKFFTLHLWHLLYSTLLHSKNDSMVKSIACSSRRPGFYSQYSIVLTTMWLLAYKCLLSPVSGSLTLLFWPLWAPGIYMHKHTCRVSTHTQNLKLKTQALLPLKSILPLLWSLGSTFKNLAFPTYSSIFSFQSHLTVPYKSPLISTFLFLYSRYYMYYMSYFY